jgi:mRNA-degrading endonuclease YafQ of YafQ-DinJ toxin-antitoxin module
MAYKLNLSKEFLKLSKKKLTNNNQLKKAVEFALLLFTINPFDPRLKSHKVESRKYGECISSRVTGDIRILWRNSEKGLQILNIFTFGGHSGTHKVYN